LNQEVRPNVQELYEVPTRVSQETIYQDDEIMIRMTYFDNVWSICTHDIMMIDFDFKEGFTRETAIQSIVEWTEYMHERGLDYLFMMYDTDRGVHAFLINQRISHLSQLGFDISMDLCNDPYYIGFSDVTGYCVRVGPKVKRPPKEGETLQDMVD
jgi:hypothetical protein